MDRNLPPSVLIGSRDRDLQGHRPGPQQLQQPVLDAPAALQAGRGGRQETQGAPRLLPLGPPARVGDLFGLHEEAGIQLRVLPNLWVFWADVIVSTLDFSGIRLRNARPR